MNTFCKFILSILIAHTVGSVTGQKITPDFSARVDTTNTAIREVSELFTAYLNSRPDSSYQNPNWNPLEYEYYLKGKDSKLERASYFLYFGLKSEQFFRFFDPFVLQIDSLGHNLYEIKTLFWTDQPEKDVIGITTHHARRDHNGEFKLENTINYFTKNWEKVQYEFIEYRLAPGIKFNEEEAIQAVKFCKFIAEKFDLDIIPFTYYLTSNTNDLGRLYNFDYWVFGITGLSNLYLREVYTAYQNLNFPHEFVHIMFPLREKGYAPRVINEGIATWLGGTSYNNTFKDALIKVRKDLEKFEEVTFDGILNQEIRNPFDSDILYVTGALICKLAYKKEGKDAIFKLYNASESTLQEKLEEMFKMPYQKFGEKILDKLIGSNE